MMPKVRLRTGESSRPVMRGFGTRRMPPGRERGGALAVARGAGAIVMLGSLSASDMGAGAEAISSDTLGEVSSTLIAVSFACCWGPVAREARPFKYTDEMQEGCQRSDDRRADCVKK